MTVNPEPPTRAGRWAAAPASVARHPVPWPMLLPFLLLFLAFVLTPIVRSAYLSFTDYDAIGTPTWLGLRNYANIFTDPVFLHALRNTLVYSLLVVGVSSLLGLYLAYKLSAPTVLNSLLRAVFFLPAVSGTIALISIFTFIFSSWEGGSLNALLASLGRAPVAFLEDPDWIMPVLVSIGVWSATGLAMVLFLAGLRAISPESLEAAALDGASPVRTFLSVTLPQLRPTLVYVTVSSGITAFQMFNESFLLRQQTNRVTTQEAGATLVTYLYSMGFERFDLGLASAVAWVLFVVVFALALLNFRLARER